MEESGGGDEGGGAGGQDGGGVGIVAKGGSAEEECVSVCECGRPCDLGRAEAGIARTVPVHAGQPSDGCGGQWPAVEALRWAYMRGTSAWQPGVPHE